MDIKVKSPSVCPMRGFDDWEVPYCLAEELTQDDLECTGPGLPSGCPLRTGPVIIEKES